MSKEIQAALFAVSKDKFTIDECERLAKDLDAHDSMRFDLVGPTGRLPARWLDAYFGFFQIDGKDGFFTAQQFAYTPDVHCENLDWTAQDRADA